MEFVEFPKMGRLTRECVVTEKIDGTNAQVHIVDVPFGLFLKKEDAALYVASWRHGDNMRFMFAGSRTRYITPQADNFGFATWAQAHADELFALGEGRHYGEWWGSGIQRGYGLKNGEKRFSLFNVARWHQVGAEPYVMQGEDPRVPPKVSTEAPACCSVVPVIHRGVFDTETINVALDVLDTYGSKAAPGFMKPEGVVVFHTATGTMFKKTLERDEQPKSRQKAAASC